MNATPRIEERSARAATTKRQAYEALFAFLKGFDSDSVLVTFLAIENILHRKLPPSARKHTSWWINKPRGEGHAKAWLDAGWLVDHVDLERGRVTFRKAGS